MCSIRSHYEKNSNWKKEEEEDEEEESKKRYLSNVRTDCLFIVECLVVTFSYKVRFYQSKMNGFLHGKSFSSLEMSYAMFKENF